MRSKWGCVKWLLIINRQQRTSECAGCREAAVKRGRRGALVAGQIELWCGCGVPACPRGGQSCGGSGSGDAGGTSDPCAFPVPSWPSPRVPLGRFPAVWSCFLCCRGRRWFPAAAVGAGGPFGIAKAAPSVGLRSSGFRNVSL